MGTGLWSKNAHSGHLELCTPWRPPPISRMGVPILTQRVAALSLLRNRELGVGGKTGLEAESTLATLEASCCQVTLHLGGYTSLHCSLPFCPQGCPDTLGSCFSPALPSPNSVEKTYMSPAAEVRLCQSVRWSPALHRGPPALALAQRPAYRSLQKNQSVGGISCRPNTCDS